MLEYEMLTTCESTFTNTLKMNLNLICALLFNKAHKFFTG